jgi:hypothetical protein
MTPSDILFYLGIVVFLVGVAVLFISGYPSDRKRTIYKEYPFSGFGDIIVKPFRLQSKGKATFTIWNIAGSAHFRIFLTDFFAGENVQFTYGPRYFQISEHGEYNIPVELGRGEYAFCIDNRRDSVSGKFTLEFEYKEYPRERFANWGLALIESGVAMTLVGFAT